MSFVRGRMRVLYLPMEGGMAGDLVLSFARQEGPHIDRLHVEARWLLGSYSALFFEAAFYKSVREVPLGWTSVAPQLFCLWEQRQRCAPQPPVGLKPEHSKTSNATVAAHRQPETTGV